MVLQQTTAATHALKLLAQDDANPWGEEKSCLATDENAAMSRVLLIEDDPETAREIMA
jgi:hypothetical protein